jgi:hypothetical protein
MEGRIKHFTNVKELQDFPDYGVDTEGSVWSFKCNKVKKLTPGWKKKGYDYKTVLLTNKYGVKKCFLIHRLVALSFIPSTDTTLDISHKNNDKSDNRLENLEWKTEKVQKKFEGYILDDFVSDKIKQVYTASIRKGLPVPSENNFFNTLIESALDSYIMQYGLRKVM